MQIITKQRPLAGYLYTLSSQSARSFLIHVHTPQTILKYNWLRAFLVRFINLYPTLTSSSSPKMKNTFDALFFFFFCTSHWNRLIHVYNINYFLRTDYDAVSWDGIIWRNRVHGGIMHPRNHCKEVRIWRRCAGEVAKHSCKL